MTTHLCLHHRRKVPPALGGCRGTSLPEPPSPRLAPPQEERKKVKAEKQTYFHSRYRQPTNAPTHQRTTPKGAAGTIQRPPPTIA